ncbi:uncharacterized protein LOC111388365 [Olea europaea var. sylvestris]|uniref:uncharacterized protein LOC111388365 n=1 Tax=Olea europaea var. sylvestris TaxID=158386 RepID=UPI000C1D18E6|nr:uncharacterized protein LOC111388365 [Olea europaea var. sylvestris]
MILDHELTPTTTPLYRFNGDSITPREKITLAIEMGESPQTTVNLMKFLIVDSRSAYHGVLGRPALKELGAVTSIHHLCIKLPTENGVITVKGDQRGSRECYHPDCCGHDRSPKRGPLERKDVDMINAPPEQEELSMINEINLLVIEHEPQTQLLLRSSKASRSTPGTPRRHKDIVCIDSKVSCHYLKIDHKVSPHRQKRRAFNPERYEASKEEVQKLIKNGFIRKAFYPKWVSNPVLMKKHNDKWRVCIDITNLNKACPKDSFPLSRIDQLVDSTTRHELLSFMDPYLG